ncbi:thermonuclease family protein [Rhizobium ruizarguesonis]
MSVITGISRAVWLFVPLGIVFLATCPAAADIAQAAYQRCGTGPRVNCVVDGDTLWNNGVKIRIADIDTPEISQPHCAAEKALGERATVRLMDLVNAGSFDILAWKNRDKDRNGRKLRVLVRDGRSIGDILVSEGLARTWTGKREPWC